MDNYTILDPMKYNFFYDAKTNYFLYATYNSET